jgi:hypothetical protein
MSRQDLATKYGLSLAGVKSVLALHKISVPMEVRQKNAYDSKLAKNPNAMADMRRSLTPEVVEARNVAIAKAYSDSPELRALKGAQSRAWWESAGPESKYTWADLRETAKDLGMAILGDHEGTLEVNSFSLKCFCGVVFDARTFDFLYKKIRSCGCVKSHAQADLTRTLQEAGVILTTNDRTVLPSGLELDIWIPGQKVAIEYCGLHWHGERWGKSKSRHLDKLKECEALGIRLITVFSDEWIDGQDKVLGYIKAVLKIPSRKVGARTLELRLLKSTEAQTFWEEAHIQGASPTPVTYGLLENGDILAALGFRPSSPLRLGEASEGFWELARYAVRPGSSVTGGFARLWSTFLEVHSPIEVRTFADLRWSQGGLYQRHGFVLEGRQPPTYSYFTRNTDAPRWHRSNFKKSQIEVLPGETEWEAMQRLGYDRIWDCGIERWTWKRHQ